MKHWGKKLAALLLCAAMATGLMPGMHLIALAYDGNPYAGLVGTTTTVKFNGMEWYLIEDGSKAVDAGTVTLLAKDPVGAYYFSGGYDNHYSTSDVKEYLEDLTADGGSFAGVRNAIMWTTVQTTNPADKSWGTDSASGGLYLLSTDEAVSLPLAVRKCSQADGAFRNAWWLRSPGDDPDEAAYVTGDNGMVYPDGLTASVTLGVRPALKLDLTKVKFYTVNVSGGANARCTYSTIENVFLLKDGHAPTVQAYYEADSNCTFPETSEYYTTTNGLTIYRSGDTNVVIQGEPTGVVNVTIPNAKLIQAIDASDVAVTYGDTDKKVSASVTTPATGGGAISYAVKSGSGDYIDVDASTGALTVKKVPENGKAYVTVTAAETDSCWAASKDVTVTISKAELTITAKDQEYIYDGDPHGEGDPAYDDSDTIAKKVTVSDPGLKNNDKLANLIMTGSKTDAGVYENEIKITGIDIKNGNTDVKGNYSITLSPGTLTITKAAQDAPVPPTAETVTENSVTLKKTAGYQYSMEGTSWQDSNVFEGLAQDTEYTFYQRLAGDENHEPSPSSEGADIRTNRITYTAVKTEGDRQTADRYTDLVVEIKRSENDAITYDHFAGVKMDGRDVPEDDASGRANWTAAKGSLVLTVKSTYMETLAAGDHTLKVLFKDGSVEIPVTISAAETSPKTGDSNHLTLWVILLAAALAGGISILIITRRKLKKNR